MGRVENGFLQLDRYFSFKVLFHSYDSGRKWVPRHPSSPWSSPPKAPRSCGRSRPSDTRAPQRDTHSRQGHRQRFAGQRMGKRDDKCIAPMGNLSTGCRQVSSPSPKTNSEWKPLKKRPIPKGRIHLPIKFAGAMFVLGKVTETTYHSAFWRFTKVYEVSSRNLRSMMDDHLYPGIFFIPPAKCLPYSSRVLVYIQLAILKSPFDHSDLEVLHRVSSRGDGVSLTLIPPQNLQWHSLNSYPNTVSQWIMKLNKGPSMK